MPGRRRILQARVHFPPVALYSLCLAREYVNVPIHWERYGVVDEEFGSGRVSGPDAARAGDRPRRGAPLWWRSKFASFSSGQLISVYASQAGQG